MGLLDGKKAIVTGGGSGIGRATCHRMAEEGASVAVLDVEGDAASLVAKEIDGVGFAVDVADPDGLREVVDAAVASLGGLNLLYNNAGVGGFSRLEEWDPAEWDRIVRINLTGVWAGFRAAVPHIRAAGGGSIVSTASISGVRPASGEGPYAASKAAVAALTASAALEYGPDIRVNAVSPGNDSHQNDEAVVRVLSGPGRTIRAGDAGGPRRRTRGRRGRGDLPLLGPVPLRDGPEHRRGRRAHAARIGR